MKHPSSPSHIAIIMDGNGRWAQRAGKARIRGHYAGAETVDRIVEQVRKREIPFLTLYTFSTENWNRPQEEVNLLMKLLVSQLRLMESKLIKRKVKLVAHGQVERLPSFVQKTLQRVIEKTATPTPALTLCLALSYGAREEIIRATQKIATQVQQGILEPEDISEQTFNECLYFKDFPDPDLLIRTGGECRVSNFMLWQIAYTEFYLTPTLWPDFDARCLDEAIDSFYKRQRRFGMTGEQVTPPEGIGLS